MKRAVTILAFVGLLGGSVYAAEHVWRIHWDCEGSAGCIGAWRQNVGTTGSFSTFAECDAYIEMQPQYGSRKNGYPLKTWCACEGAGCRTVQETVPDYLWKMYLIGGVSGALVASFMQEGADGGKPIIPMGLNWGGWMLGAGTLLAAKKMPPAGFGVSAGAATLSGVVGYEQYKNYKGRDDGTTKETKDIVKDGLIASAAVGGTAYAFRKFATSKAIGPIVRALGKLNIFVIGRGIIGSVRW